MLAIIKYSFAKSLPGSGPRHMRCSIDGNLIYLLNKLSLSVATINYDSKNRTAKLVYNTPAFSEEINSEERYNSAAQIVVHLNGGLIFSSKRRHDSITYHLIESNNGYPSVIEVEPIRGSWPWNINLDPKGFWLLSDGQHSNKISVHSIDQ